MMIRYQGMEVSGPYFGVWNARASPENSKDLQHALSRTYQESAAWLSLVLTAHHLTAHSKSTQTGLLSIQNEILSVDPHYSIAETPSEGV